MKKSKFTKSRSPTPSVRSRADPHQRMSAGSSGSAKPPSTWKKKYAHLGVSELRKLRSLEDENARLKRVVADLSRDKHILTEALRKKG